MAPCPYCGFDPAGYQLRANQLPPYTILHGEFMIGEVVGHGGFGIVYRAFDLNLQSQVAVKELFPEGLMTRTQEPAGGPDAGRSGSSSAVTYIEDSAYIQAVREKFVREARILARLESQQGDDGIVRVHSLFSENGTDYMVMEFLEGQTLKEYLKIRHTIKWQELLDLLYPCMKVLEQLHRQGIIHRDISPDNIMILEHSGRLKLLDFGNVKVNVHEQDYQSTKIPAIKKGYSPIEQYSAKAIIGPETDIYALCATIYRCLTGTVPPEPPEIMLSGLKKPSEMGVQIPKDAEDILLKGLSVKLADRVHHIEDLISVFYAGSADSGRSRNKTIPGAGALKGNKRTPETEALKGNKRTPEAGALKGNKRTPETEEAAGRVEHPYENKGRSGGFSPGSNSAGCIPPDSRDKSSTENSGINRPTGGGKAAEKKTAGKLLIGITTAGVLAMIVLMAYMLGARTNDPRHDQSASSKTAGTAAVSGDSASEESSGNAGSGESEEESQKASEKARIEESEEESQKASEKARIEESEEESQKASEKARTEESEKESQKASERAWTEESEKESQKASERARIEESEKESQKASEKAQEEKTAGGSEKEDNWILNLVDSVSAISGKKKEIEDSGKETREAAEKDETAWLEETAARDWTMNELMEEHGTSGELDESGGVPEAVETVFGVSEWKRDEIKGIYVLSSLSDMPDNAVDVSKAGDGGVMAWVNEKNKLFIAGEGGVKAAGDCSALFAWYKNAKVIDLGGNLHTDDTTDFRFMFYHCTAAKEINLEGIHTARGKNFSKMFVGCRKLESLDVSSFDTSQAESLYAMFAKCANLKELHLENFRTSNVRSFDMMFWNCESLEYIYLTPELFDTSATDSLGRMFSKCLSLKYVDVSGFNTENVLAVQAMFSSCEKLTHVDVEGWDLSHVINHEHMFIYSALESYYGTNGERLFN